MAWLEKSSILMEVTNADNTSVLYITKTEQFTPLESCSWRLMLFLKRKRAAACTLFEPACRQRVAGFQPLRTYCMSGFIV